MRKGGIQSRPLTIPGLWAAVVYRSCVSGREVIDELPVHPGEVGGAAGLN